MRILQLHLLSGKGLYILLFLFVFSAGCRKSNDPPAISFYYWKTQFKLMEREKAVLDSCKVKRLYVRYFDVVMNGRSAIPNAPIEFLESPPGLEIIPVVFIRNNVLEDDGEDIHVLSRAITRYVAQIDSVAGIKSNELQLDCDWSQSTKGRFMEFVSLVKEISGKRISTTIRLHQVKYPTRTGVPKADNGVLMYYNMGTLGDTSRNSIYDRETAEGYLSGLSDYPLPLTPALPLFGWGVQVRDGNVVGLVNKVGLVDFAADTNFRSLGSEIFVSVKANIKFGRFFQAGDMVKLEYVKPDQLLEMASELGGRLRNPPTEVIFYDLDQTNFHKFGHDDKKIKEASALF